MRSLLFMNRSLRFPIFVLSVYHPFAPSRNALESITKHSAGTSKAALAPLSAASRHNAQSVRCSAHVGRPFLGLPNMLSAKASMSAAGSAWHERTVILIKLRCFFFFAARGHGIMYHMQGRIAQQIGMYGGAYGNHRSNDMESQRSL